MRHKNCNLVTICTEVKVCHFISLVIFDNLFNIKIKLDTINFQVHIIYVITTVYVNRKLYTPPFLSYTLMILLIKVLFGIKSNMFNKNLPCTDKHEDYK